MAADEGVARLTWDVADALLSANFSFRTLAGQAGARSYRLAANGQELSAKPTTVGAGVLVRLPNAVAGLQPAPDAAEGSAPGQWYVVSSIAELESVIAAVRGEMARRASGHCRALSDEPGGMQPIEGQSMNPVATNTILYGPPGTGKTYATAGRAVLLCDGALPGDGLRASVMERYEALRKDGRIRFVTFHQSYGYEEFIEGLRPQASTTGQVAYSVVPGAFRRACDSARLRRMATPGLSGKPLRDRTVFKMSLGASGTNEAAEVFKYCLANQCVLLGWGDEMDFTGCRDDADIRAKLLKEAPGIEKPDSVVRYVNYFMHELKVGDLIIASHGNRAFRGIAEVTGAYEYAEDGPFRQARPVKWLAVFEAGRATSEVSAKDFTMSSLYKLTPAAINFDALRSLVAPSETTGEIEPHVLIIDEINRANISKVFGELITLLEPDKREGAANAITLKLPYSGEDFAVPSNLHVLGTMNTADRSIALLDTALRRRFDFEELMPRPGELRGLSINGVELERLLTALNERVEALYDRDHTIGHAFFMDVRSLSDLESVFRRKVLPLLQEYFYERWSDIRRVLNDLGEGDFVRRRTLPQVSPDGEEPYPDEPRVVYSVNQASFPAAAYQRIYGA